MIYTYSLGRSKAPRLRVKLVKSYFPICTDLARAPTIATRPDNFCVFATFFRASPVPPLSIPTPQPGGAMTRSRSYALGPTVTGDATTGFLPSFLHSSCALDSSTHHHPRAARMSSNKQYCENAGLSSLPCGGSRPFS